MPTRPSPKAEHPLDRGVLDELLGFHLRLTQLAIHEGFEQDSPVPDITVGQLTILILIDRNPDLTQQRLCERLRVKKSTLTVTLHRLSRRGLVRRARSTVDRRANALKLTPKGSRVLSTMVAAARRYERELSSRLTAGERQTLIRLLAKVAGAPGQARG